MATWNPFHPQEEEALQKTWSGDSRDQGNERSVDKNFSRPPQLPSSRSSKRTLCIVVGVVVLLLIIACAIAIPLAVRKPKNDSKSNDTSSSSSTNSLARACDVTLYPSVCYDAISGLVNGSTPSPQNLVKYSINAATDGLIKEVADAQELLKDRTEDDVNLSAVAQDCILQLQDSLDSLNQTLDGVRSFTIFNAADTLADLETWMSAALTTQQTCVDSFDELGINATGPVGDFLKSANYTTMLVSNALAFVTTLKDIAVNLPNIPGNRRLLTSQVDKFSVTFVNPLSRRLLQNATSANVVVAKDGSGNFKKIQDAVDQAPQKLKGSKQYVIQIKAGKYVETVTVPKSASNIIFIGDGMGKTVISGSLSVVGSGVTTSATATLTVRGKNFIGRDFTVENTAGAANHQAVAMRVTGDFSAFERCEFLGKQDTLYPHTNRQFYKDCKIVGTVDFIFGNAAVVFQGCQILASTGLGGQQNTYTASGRIDPNQNTGISFQNCTFDGDASLKAAPSGAFLTYLGRPWKPYARTIVMQSSESALLDTAGWLQWNGETQHFPTIYYAEYANRGPGSATAKRVSWSKQITKPTDANKFAVETFINGNSWLPQTDIFYQKSV